MVRLIFKFRKIVHRHKCDGKYRMRFVANSSRIQQWKHFENQRTFARVMNECIVAQFLTHCVYKAKYLELRS